MSKISAARNEYSAWCTAMGINSLKDVSRIVTEGKAPDLINLSEARQERKYAEAADQIFFNKDRCKIVMMSGPSSSGKTSSSLRIAQQARVLGLNPKVIELDNYFVNREFTPVDVNGEKNYDCLEAMDVAFLNEQLVALLNGEEIDVPKFNFVSGHREFTGKKLRLQERDILFMEGIHALNPALTPSISQDNIFKIYISSLSALPGGTKSHHSTTDKRLLRRIVRDNRTRGITPEENILRWPSVRRGEINYIFPFEENANVVLNTSTPYDLPLIKYYAEPLLYEVFETSPAYKMAQNLIEFLSSVEPLKPSDIAVIPPTSIMREFIGGQVLR